MGLFDRFKGKPAAASAMAKDPVCGMSVDPAKAAGTSSHGGKTFHFCSTGCKKRFDADPHKFAGAHSH